MAFISSLAENLGASEAALRLLVGQLMGYPVMLVYRRLVASQHTTIQHIYFILTGQSLALSCSASDMFSSGLLAAWYVIGEDVKHSMFVVATTYIILVTAGGTLISVIISFVFNFGYLLLGYYFTMSEGYDICWTMPHCVMTLRLIGLTFDLYDGARAKRFGREALTKDQEKSALEEAPTPLEMFSHSFFLGGYFVGPLILMKKYQQFVCPNYQYSLPSSPLPYGFMRFGLGVSYMLVHIIGSALLPADWPISEHFLSINFITRMFLLAIWCRIVLAKYLSAWLIAEGVCVISGLSFAGYNEDGSPDWKGCANVKISRLELSTKFGHVIESFNINTNNWVAVYIYKRLKFLGSRTVSQVLTLLFLAVWHGFHFGYYLVFLNEFLIIKLEREFLSIWGRSKKVERWMESPLLARLVTLAGWCWVTFLLPHCFIAFVLLTFPRFYTAYKATYFFLCLVFLAWTLLKGTVKRFLLNENPKITRDVQPVPDVSQTNHGEKAVSSSEIKPSEASEGEGRREDEDKKNV